MIELSVLFILIVAAVTIGVFLGGTALKEPAGCAAAIVLVPLLTIAWIICAVVVVCAIVTYG